ncbi:MAG TPA: Smr/MutS family protein [Stellaceae bacterium]
MSRRAIDPAEQALWRDAMRDVARRRAATKVAGERPEEDSLSGPAGGSGLGRGGAGSAIPPPHLTSPPPRAERDSSAEKLHVPTPGLDRRSALRLKRGQRAIEARLDLHGMTQIEAHRALAGFITRSHAAGKRALLVITGKGLKEGSGVLRAAVPRWLGEPALRPRVLAVTPAMPKDGGAGALYILLRRAR